MPVSGTPKEIVHEEMSRYKRGQLHSGPDKYGHLAKSRAQAIAIAMSVANRKGRAMGGQAPQWMMRQEARGESFGGGPIRSMVAGRTDHIPMTVPSGSYVLPAQHVSHLGQNNTEAGFARLNHMFSSGPFGAPLTPIRAGRGAPAPPAPPRLPGPTTFHQGGVPGEGDRGVQIMAAGGEFVIPPHIVKIIGHGNIRWGHQILDEWVKKTKQKHAKTIAKLPGPARD
jgi:hypothetical protein